MTLARAKEVFRRRIRGRKVEERDGVLFDNPFSPKIALGRPRDVVKALITAKPPECLGRFNDALSRLEDVEPIKVYHASRAGQLPLAVYKLMVNPDEAVNLATEAIRVVTLDMKYDPRNVYVFYFYCVKPSYYDYYIAFWHRHTDGPVACAVEAFLYTGPGDEGKGTTMRLAPDFTDWSGAKPQPHTNVRVDLDLGLRGLRELKEGVRKWASSRG